MNRKTLAQIFPAAFESQIIERMLKDNQTLELPAMFFAHHTFNSKEEILILQFVKEFPNWRFFEGETFTEFFMGNI